MVDKSHTEEITLEIESILAVWQEQLGTDLPNQPHAVREAIIQWIVGEPIRFQTMSAAELGLAHKAMDYRYRIFISRYWGVPPETAYKRLLQKLGGLFLIRSKVRTWIAMSRDRKRAVKDVLQEVIQEMLQSDRYMKQQTQWISQCTQSSGLRNLLLLATVEEYCLRPIRNQPLLVYRFVSYLRRSQRGGITQIPISELIQLISEDTKPDQKIEERTSLDTTSYKKVFSAPLTPLINSEPLIEGDASSRIAAISALTREGNENAVPLLCHILATDDSSEVRSSAARALGLIAAIPNSRQRTLKNPELPFESDHDQIRLAGLNG
jgi:HEAT repeats